MTREEIQSKLDAISDERLEHHRALDELDNEEYELINELKQIEMGE